MPEVRKELKPNLSKLQSMCNIDFQQNLPLIRTFLEPMNNIADILDLPLADRVFRNEYGCDLLDSIAQHFPQLGDVSARRRSAGRGGDKYLTITFMLAHLGEKSWEIKHNDLTYKLCNCRLKLPGTVGCAVPAVVEEQNKFPRQVKGAMTERLRGKKFSSKQWPPGSRQRHANKMDEKPQPKARVQAATSSGVSDLMRLEEMRRTERHFPRRLMEMSECLRSRLREFAREVPAIAHEFSHMCESPTHDQLEHTTQQWEKFVANVAAQFTFLDHYYLQFEKLYVSVIGRLIGSSLEQARGMSTPSAALQRSERNVFRDMETAVICQRLGFVKRKVRFGGMHNLVSFDPRVLMKAERVLQMDTYAHVRNMAENLLVRFRELCTVLTDLNSERSTCELRNNTELSEAVLSLEEAWAECQYILCQDTLDFIGQLLKSLSKVSEEIRWQLWHAMNNDTSASSSGQEEHEHLVDAQAMLFEKLPILVYLEELWKDIKLERARHEAGVQCTFSILFCPQDDRHQMLRRELGKFDEARLERLNGFVMGKCDTPVLSSRLEHLAEGRVTPNASNNQCIVSFPGAFIQEWAKLLATDRTLASACVFLPTVDPKRRYGRHVPTQTHGKCWCHSLYGRQMDWGCYWFKAWMANVQRALDLGLELVVVFFPNQVNRGIVEWDELATMGNALWSKVGLGGSQKGEVAMLNLLGHAWKGICVTALNELVGLPAPTQRQEQLLDEGRQIKYFKMIHNHLTDIAAFATGSPEEVLCAATDYKEATKARDVDLHLDTTADPELEEQQRRRAVEANARWVCVMRVAQRVAPELFPMERPATPGIDEYEFEGQELMPALGRKATVRRSMGSTAVRGVVAVARLSALRASSSLGGAAAGRSRSSCGGASSPGSPRSPRAARFLEELLDEADDEDLPSRESAAAVAATRRGGPPHDGVCPLGAVVTWAPPDAALHLTTAPPWGRQR